MQHFVSDIHGNLDLFEEIIKHWRTVGGTLNVLGDYVDRGYDSLGVLKRIYELSSEPNFNAIMGNHDEMFLDALDTGRYDLWLQNGGGVTVQSITADIYKNNSLEHIFVLEALDKFKETYPHLIEMVRNLPYYVESEFAIGVHAGLVPDKDTWKDTPKSFLTWAREEYFDLDYNNTGKIILSGHTPVGDVKNIGHNKYMIDGGGFHSGQLNLVTVNSLTDMQIIKFERNKSID